MLGRFLGVAPAKLRALARFIPFEQGEGKPSSTGTPEAAPVRLGEMYAGYSTDSVIRGVASSGGIVTAVLRHLLRKGEVDAVLVSRITAADGPLQGVTELVSSEAALLEYAGSSYVDTPVLTWIRHLRTYAGKVAIVALPCQVRSLNRLFEKQPELRRKVPFVIGLFCRGTVDPPFYHDWLTRQGLRHEDVSSVQVKRNHYRGEVVFAMKGGQKRRFPFQAMNSYRLAGCHATHRCCWCAEHLAEEADLAVGDIFLPEFKHRNIKHSAFVPRTSKAAELVNELRERGELLSEFVGTENYRRRFAKIERFSNTLEPRYLAARLAGLRPLRGKVEWVVNPFHCLAWTLYFWNCRLSKTPKGRRFLYALPSPAMTFVALLVKGLSRV